MIPRPRVLSWEWALLHPYHCWCSPVLVMVKQQWLWWVLEMAQHWYLLTRQVMNHQSMHICGGEFIYWTTLKAQCRLPPTHMHCTLTWYGIDNRDLHMTICTKLGGKICWAAANNAAIGCTDTFDGQGELFTNVSCIRDTSGKAYIE